MLVKRKKKNREREGKKEKRKEEEEKEKDKGGKTNAFETKTKIPKLISYSACEACQYSAHRDRKGTPSVPSSQACLQEEGATKRRLVKLSVYYK